MHGKTLLFGDEEIAARILKTTDPKKIKALGREVKDFTYEQWKKNREIIVYQNSVAKFTQNDHLREALLKTTGLLVEASPYDKIWGIGMREDEARRVPKSKWRGLNLLGKILTRVREKILADGGGEERVGDLLDLASNGELDVIIHGCNCFNTMGAGIAKLIKSRWPEAYQADLSTKRDQGTSSERTHRPLFAGKMATTIWLSLMHTRSITGSMVSGVVNVVSIMMP